MSIESSFEKPQMPEPEKEPQEEIELKQEKSKLQTEFEKHEKEREKIQGEVRPEIEAKFRSGLESLHTKIQSTEKFPPKDKLEEFIEEIPIFAQLAEGAKNIFIGSLLIKKKFRSPDQEVFVEQGMKSLELFIHTSVLKKGGEIWLQQKMEERETKNIQSEKIEE